MATGLATEQLDKSFQTPRTIEVPASTAWPFILAFGVTLLFAGLVTSMSVSVLGGALALAGVRGWVAPVFPHAAGEAVPGGLTDTRPTTDRPAVGRGPGLRLLHATGLPV